MPLYTYARPAIDTPGNPKALLLKGELPHESFMLPEDKMTGVRPENWRLRPNFDQRWRWVPGAGDFNIHNGELAAFMCEQIKKPFYVSEVPQDAYVLLQLVLFDPDDIRKFADRFPEWEFEADAQEQNAQILRVWRSMNYSFDSRLDPYVAKEPQPAPPGMDAAPT